jgi:redox-sensitive bicupin YhaK (pirin superfamily)
MRDARNLTGVMDMSIRNLTHTIPSIATSDGAGVKLRRSLGSREELRLDPFLMLDEFFSDDPNDYLAGFPSHPHRGFETVTYMLDGHMRHEDSVGNRGDLGPGDVQWMTAGRGIIHSEMPQQTAGRMRGFQLWVNLPAREKMRAPEYRDIPSSEIPTVPVADGGTLRVIAGEVDLDGVAVRGPIRGPTTEPVFIDLKLPPGARVDLPMAATHNAFVYVYEGTAGVGTENSPLPHRAAGILSEGDHVRIEAGPDGVQALLLAGRPIGESITQYGPFVMNTRAEIEQAVRDYQRGALVSG